MDQIEIFKKTYFEECSDLLGSGEAHLMALADEPGDAQGLAALFRAVHSIKGGAGAFGFDRLVRFAHIFETILDSLRSGVVTLDRAGHGLLMRAFDQLSDLVAAARDGGNPPDAAEAEIARGLADWHEKAGGGGVAAPAGKAEAAMVPKGRTRYRIRFAPHPHLLRKAHEPLYLVRELKTLGEVTVRVDLSRLPEIEVMDPDVAYLAWVMEISTEVGRDRLLEVFEFVLDDCDLDIDEIHDAPATGSALVTADPGSTEVAASGGLETADGEAARGRGGAVGGAAPISIRVDLDKIDRLVNMVGEIVITQAMIAQQVVALEIDGYTELVQRLEQMAQHTRELQDSVMSIRAQPVKSVFGRMPRLVREIATALGKEVRVATAGEMTEVDKTVIEQLSEPLTHMVRNAVDHGIETPDDRVAAGKPREGTILLSAEHRGGRIVIEVTDDGAGIDRARVRRKCVEKGLIAPDAVLTDEEIDNFIFQPGFSTASQISNISGRGVGMDVVKRNILALGGRVHLTSRPGAGSRFTLSLPLTLAVLDGMIVTVGGERYIIPLTSIIESLRPRAGDLSRLAGGVELLAIRGEYVRLIHLARAFDISGAVTDPTAGLIVLVDVEAGEKIGLVVDEILGQQQVVIKSLEANYQRIAGISAATILGDGRVALILDLGGLGRLVDARPSGAPTPERVIA